MNQIKFGRRYDMTPQAARRAGRDSQALAVAVPQDDNGLRLGLMIAGGMLAGFIVAAIECL